MKTYSILLFLIITVSSLVNGQVVLKEQPIDICLDSLAVYEKEGITFSIDKAQKEKGGTIPLRLSIKDLTATYVITSTGFAYGRGYVKEDGEKGQYCQPLLKAQHPISYWKLVVPAYSKNIPKTLYLRLEISKCISTTQIWEKGITRIPIFILLKE
jgi:hypothetical protein